MSHYTVSGVRDLHLLSVLPITSQLLRVVSLHQSRVSFKLLRDQTDPVLPYTVSLLRILGLTNACFCLAVT